MSAVPHVSAATFADEVLHSDVPVLVDFYADWCGPCRALAPSLTRLSAEFAGRVKIVKVNVDDEPELAGRYAVESIPTLIALAGGETIGRVGGLVPEANLRQALNLLANAS